MASKEHALEKTSESKRDSENDESLKRILEQAQRIAVLGIKGIETEDAFRVPQYMQSRGYQIIPVNPKLETILGEPAYANLEAVQRAGISVNLINLFRATENIPAHVDEILGMSPLPEAVWMQLGIHHGPSAARLRAAGIEVIQDRCIMVDHRRLLGPHPD